MKKQNEHTKALPIRKSTNATERKGIAFVRDAVEDANCVFKEIDRASDFGHDAFVLLVDGEQVMPQEFAVQIKAGKSFCKPECCSFFATEPQLNFWARHPLQTLGIVYDPDVHCAWWVDLKVEAKSSQVNGSGRTIRFAKEDWNKFDAVGFKSVVLPILLEEPPRISLKTATQWLESDSWDTHDLGARVLISRHKNEASAWTAMLSAFESRGRKASFSVFCAIVKMLGNSEVGYLPNSIPDSIRISLQRQILGFGELEIVELLHFVDDNGYERGSAGYGLFALFPSMPDHVAVLSSIATNAEFPRDVRENAGLLLAIRENDPDWWNLWLRQMP